MTWIQPALFPDDALVQPPQPQPQQPQPLLTTAPAPGEPWTQDQLPETDDEMRQAA